MPHGPATSALKCGDFGFGKAGFTALVPLMLPRCPGALPREQKQQGNRRVKARFAVDGKMVTYLTEIKRAGNGIGKENCIE